MLGAGLQFSRNLGEDRFYNPAKARRCYANDQLRRAQSDVTPRKSISDNKKSVVLTKREPEELVKSVASPACETLVSPLSNLERFLESVVPSVPAQYFPQTAMRGWRTCDVEFQPFFVLGDLWEAFKEWSAYGAGVPLILNDTDSVVQYYVPYLSGIQLYGKTLKSSSQSRRPGEESDSDFRDSSSEGSSDCETEREFNRLSLIYENVALQEDFSGDEGEPLNSQGVPLFEYLERDPPYSRGPLADKISELARHFPELKLLRSCDLLSSSWMSVAWYPIYRIPLGPTLKDLDACFLTYHFLHTPVGVSQSAQAPVITHPGDMDGVPKMSLPPFGLASYKFKGSIWTSSGGSDQKLPQSLSQAADDWLRSHQVNHPDFQFFCRRQRF